MGCDIHLFAERLNLETGVWEYLPAPDPKTHNPSYRFEHEDTSTPFLPEWFEDRNYLLFGMLAGVRDHSYEPVDQPRGIPDNVSPEIQEEWVADGGHTPSWLMLSELLAYFASEDPHSLMPMGDIPQTKRFQTFLTELGTYGTPETLRIVFWYDS